MSASVEGRSFDGPYGEVSVRCYTPATPSTGLVWVHGGAFVDGDLDMPEADFVSRSLADLDIAVVSVAYQLSPLPVAWGSGAGTPVRPGVHFPVASEEVTAAFIWATRSLTALEVDQWAIGGASAGANLAAGAALRLRDAAGPMPRAVVLAYPTLHAALPPSAEELQQKVSSLDAPDLRFPAAIVTAMNANYLGEASIDSPYAFPGGQDLAGLPPTFVLNSDFDDLRASGQAFAAELAAAGVDVLQIREDGTLHGHLNDPGSHGTDRSIARIAAWLTSDLLLGVAHETSQTRTVH